MHGPIGGRDDDVIMSNSNWSNLLFTCIQTPNIT